MPKLNLPLQPTDYSHVHKLTVEEAVEQCRLIRDELRATSKLRDWLLAAFGSDSERHGVNFGMYPRWAYDEAVRLLDWKNKSIWCKPAGANALTDFRADLLAESGGVVG